MKRGPTPKKDVRALRLCHRYIRSTVALDSNVGWRSRARGWRPALRWASWYSWAYGGGMGTEREMLPVIESCARS